MKNQNQLELQTKELLYKHIKAELTPLDTKEDYKHMLEDLFGETNLCGYMYRACDALRALDPAGYEVGHSNFLVRQTREKRYYKVDTEYYDYDHVQEIINSIEVIMKTPNKELQWTTHNY